MSVILVRIMKEGGCIAVLDEENQVNGNFNFGVKSKDGQGKRRSLEYDLTDCKKGILKEYDNN
jgi:hypothetical protein